MNYIEGQERTQLELQPTCLDDYVSENNMVRVIEAFVSMLDMVKLGFKNAVLNKEGRPPFNPAALLKLYIYGYLNLVRSSRRLEAETHRNVEVMWLLCNLTPDDKTISNFRKDNAEALKKVYREFSKLCNKLGLHGKELVAQDGTKVRANSSRHNIFDQRKAEKALAATDKKIEKYMNMLDENDAAESKDPRYNADDIAEILKALSGKKETLESLLDQINERDGEPVSIVDPDAHIMKQSGEGRPYDACYNVHTVVDSKHNLILDFKISTNASDSGELFELTESAKEIMEVDAIAATADKGFYSADDIAACEENGTTCYVPKVNDKGRAPDPAYNKRHFKYDKENDCYICPEGKALPYKRASFIAAGVTDGRLYQDTKACKTCAKRALCTQNKKQGRTLKRLLNQDALDTVDKRMRTRHGRLILKRRRELVEHPFGTVKKVWGYGQYLCRGLARVTAEQSMAFLAYNLRRVINIFHNDGADLLLAMGS